VLRVIFQLRVLFANDKFKIPAEFDAHLRECADFMKKHAEVRLNVAGHASATGPEDQARNIKLAQNRANAVRDRLIKLGVDPRRLTTSAHSDKIEAEQGQHGVNRRTVGITTEGDQIGAEERIQGYQGEIK